MNRVIAPLCFALAFAACDNGPGPHPGEQQLWTIGVEDRVYSACTDDPQFRSGLDAITGLDGTYLAYEVSDDGKTARTMACTALDVSYCEVEANGLTFNVVDSHLIYSETVRSPIKYSDGTTSKCEIELTLNWDLEDKGDRLEGTTSFLYGLAGDVAECAEIEEQTVAASGNGEGVDGCSVSMKMTGSAP